MPKMVGIPSARIRKNRSMILCQSSGWTCSGEIHRAFHVGEEHRHLLALAFKGAPRCEDLLGEMLRSVGAWVSSFAAAPSGFPQSPQNRSPG